MSTVRLLRITLALTFCLLTGFSGCADPMSMYFPLEPGLRWDYRTVTVGHDGEARRQRIIIQNTDIIEREGQRYLVQQSADGKQVYYRLQEDGIVLLEDSPEDAMKEEMYLGLPAKPGRFWSHGTDLLTLNIFGPAYRTSERLETRLDMTFRIKSTRSQVKTPANTYENCLEVQGNAETHVDRSEFLGVDTIHVEETRWYAPGVGLVKRERREYTEPKEFSGRLTQTLIDFGAR